MAGGFDESQLSPEELWDWCVAKYESSNPLVKMLYRRFFGVLRDFFSRLRPKDRLIEIGCGPGQSSLCILELLSGQHFEVSEPDERYVTMLERKGFPLHVTRESVYDLQRADGEFDWVLLLEVLEHLDDVERALAEVFRVARRYVVISVPNEPLWRVVNMARGKYWRDLGNTPGHVNHWSTRELVRLVSRFGSIEEVRVPLMWTVVLVRVGEGRAQDASADGS